MYHTFQATTAGALKGPGDGGDALALGAKHSRPQGSRRITTTNACVECRRRKIRCDGQHPCGQCLWYQHPHNCNYAKPAQRVVPSRKLVEKLQGTIDQQKRILEKLFPGKDVDNLVSIPREELIDLVLTLPAPLETSPSDSGAQTIQSAQTPDDEDAGQLSDPLEELENRPEGGVRRDETQTYDEGVQVISDSVNGLSIGETPSAYVGVSSVQAAQTVMQKCAPEEKVITEDDTPPPSRTRASPSVLQVVYPDMSFAPGYVEAYFEKVHPFFPMVDEKELVKNFESQHRQDAPWFALINMVLALGCLASAKQDNEIHLVFYKRARQYLSFRSFGSMNIETVQAFGMMAGFYMHWLNRPEEASALMGAAMRMATGLGLHREYSASASHRRGRTSKPRSHEETAEMRRRTWWSLFCLDVWASTTTSRPSLGRISSAVSVLPPGKVSEEPGNTPHRQDFKVLPLTHNVEFCRIATLIQDTLATSRLKYEELQQLDHDLVAWRESLPSILTNFDEDCVKFLHVPRRVMKWRYQNLRIVLHRPFLLRAALRRATYAMLTAEEKVAVGRLRVIAGQTIKDMSEECTEDLISGWNAVWFCYQACLIPLVSLFYDLSNTEEIVKWQGQVEAALEFIERIKDYSVAARKTKERIAYLYEISKIHLEKSTRAARSRMEAQEAWHNQQQQQRDMKFDEKEAVEADMFSPGVPDFSQHSVQSELLRRQPQVQPDLHLSTSEGQFNSYISNHFEQSLSQPHFVDGTAAPAPVNTTGIDNLAFWPTTHHQHHYQQPAAPQLYQYNQQHHPTPMMEQSGPSSLGSVPGWDDIMWDNTFYGMIAEMGDYQSPTASVGSGGIAGGIVPAGTAQQRAAMGMEMGNSQPGTGVQGAWGLG